LFWPERLAFYERIGRKHLTPLWTSLAKLVTPEPESGALDLTLSALPPEGFGGMVNLTAGSDAKVIGSVGTTTDEFDVTQAYVHFAKGGLMVIGGKYVTLSGAEVIKSPSNTNFSRSILFGYAIPFTHTGVRAYFTPGGSAAAPDGKWTFIAGLNNGWPVTGSSRIVRAKPLTTAVRSGSRSPTSMLTISSSRLSNEV